MKEQNNYNLTEEETDFIKNSVEHFLNCMPSEDRDKYNQIAEDITERLSLK